MDRVNALKTLRLSGDPERKAVIAAYTRLARRYPMQQFAERHSLLLQAKELLLKPEVQFKNIFFADQVTMSWYQPKPAEPPSIDDSLDKSVQQILHPFFCSSARTYNASNSMRTLEDMMRRFSPEEMQKMIEEDFY